MSSADVVAQFKTAGLPAASLRPMSRADFGLAPMKTSDATRFLIPPLGADKGGRAFRFESTSDLRELKSYYDEFGKQSAALFSHTFANEDAGVLVQINGDLPDNEAAKYRKVVDGL